ncbi:MAG: HEAT repeat domain-containing protein [Promethearchaeota archaeon]
MTPKPRRKYIDELIEELEKLHSSKAMASKIKNVIDKIGNLADKKAIPYLKKFLEHETDYVRASTVQALEKIRNYPKLSRTLMKIYEREKSLLVRIAIVEALGELEDENALSFLDNIKNDERSPDKLKISAIFSIDRLTGGKVSALKQLVEYLIDSPNPNIRVEAAKTLAKLGDPRAIRYLREALDDEKIFVRKFVIKALLTYKDKSVIDSIIDAFKDEKVFLDRDFVKVLWVFPEYEGKELWEIIEIRNQEKLRELNIPIDDGNGLMKHKSDILDAYEYELNKNVDDEAVLSQGKLQRAPKPDQETRPIPTNERSPPRETISDEQEKAKKEMVPSLKESIDELGKKELLNKFSNFFLAGEKYYRKKSYYKAIINFKKALDVKPDAWQAWYNIALIFYDVNEKEKSLECFKHALEFKPNEIDAMLNIASLQLELGDYRSAIKHFVNALQMSKYQPDAWLILGRLFYKLKLHGFALFCFNQVLKFSKNNKERKEARVFSERIMKNNPSVTQKNPLKRKIPEFTDPHLKLDLK